MPQVGRRGLAVLFLAVFIAMMGFGVVLPVLQFYAREVGATPFQIGLLATSYAVMQFLFAPVWGAVSDRIGRKPIFVLGLLGYAVSFVIFGLSHQVWELFLARILGGILSAATLPTAMAYVADTTSEEHRGGAMGMMGAAMGLGFTIGPGIGGILGQRHLALPFFVGAGLALLTLLLSWERSRSRSGAPPRRTARLASTRSGWPWEGRWRSSTSSPWWGRSPWPGSRRRMRCLPRTGCT
jgi:multidrug resistance protein